MARRLASWLGCVLLLGGCASTASRSQMVTFARAGQFQEALAVYEARSEHDPQAVQQLARILIEREALSRDARRERAAFAELALASHAARPLLEQLALPTRRERVRAQALSALSRLGDEGARALLQQLASAVNPEVVDWALPALDPVTDRERLLQALLSPRAGRRLAAIGALTHAPEDPALLRALSERSAHDPEIAVRAGAVSALSAQGPQASEAVTRALTDAALPVRSAAFFALTRIDPALAEARLSQRLGGPPTPESLDAARALLAMRASTERPRALAHVLQALRGEHAQLRIYAVAALAGAPQDAATHTDPLRAQLAVETVPAVRLALARLLGAADPAASLALRQLLEPASATAASAAAELARRGDAAALARLQALLVHPLPAIRRVAAFSLARDLDRPHDLRALLADDDPSVRLRAAALLLGAD